MNFFVIRHIPSGVYFPLSSRGGKRGSTYIDLPFTGVPRLFTRKCAAVCTLDWWLGGKAVAEYDYDGDGRYAVGASAGNGNPARKREEFEVLAVELKEHRE